MQVRGKLIEIVAGTEDVMGKETTVELPEVDVDKISTYYFDEHVRCLALCKVMREKDKFFISTGHGAREIDKENIVYIHDVRLPQQHPTPTPVVPEKVRDAYNMDAMADRIDRLIDCVALLMEERKKEGKK